MDCDWNNEAAMRAAIREEAERVLRARVKPTFPDCQGPCDQGRKLCPCPDACERMVDEPRNAKPLMSYVDELIDTLNVSARMAIFVCVMLALWAGVVAATSKFWPF
jgi:hypothetical protein